MYIERDYRVRFLGSALSYCCSCRTENQMSADPGKNRRSKRIECLHQVQTAGSGPRRSQYSDIRISRDLKNGDSCRQNNERSEKEGERDDLGRRNREDEVGREECSLD